MKGFKDFVYLNFRYIEKFRHNNVEYVLLSSKKYNKYVDLDMELNVFDICSNNTHIDNSKWRSNYRGKFDKTIHSKIYKDIHKKFPIGVYLIKAKKQEYYIFPNPTYSNILSFVLCYFDIDKINSLYISKNIDINRINYTRHVTSNIINILVRNKQSMLHYVTNINNKSHIIIDIFNKFNGFLLNSYNRYKDYKKLNFYLFLLDNTDSNTSNEKLKMLKEDLSSLAMFFYCTDYYLKFKRDFCLFLHNTSLNYDMLLSLNKLEKYKTNNLIDKCHRVALEYLLENFLGIKIFYRYINCKWSNDNIHHLYDVFSLYGWKYITLLQILNNIKKSETYTKFSFLSIIQRSLKKNKEPLTFLNFEWNIEQCEKCTNCISCKSNNKCSNCSSCNSCQCSGCKCIFYRSDKFKNTKSYCKNICIHCNSCTKSSSCIKTCYTCINCKYCNYCEICISKTCSLSRDSIRFNQDVWLKVYIDSRENFCNKLAHINISSQICVFYILQVLLVKWVNNKDTSAIYQAYNIMKLLYSNYEYLNDVSEMFESAIYYLSQFEEYCDMIFYFNYWHDVMLSLIKKNITVDRNFSFKDIDSVFL